MTQHGIPKKQMGEANELAMTKSKKKDESANASNNYDKIASSNSTGKRTLKQKEQVSFGPAY